MSNQATSLQTIQRWMQDALMFPGQTSGESTTGLINPSSRQTAEQRLAVYQRSYYLRLQKCMREQFPALCHALGEQLFNDFSSDYLQSKPSVSHTLYELGQRFPDHLEQTRPDAGEKPEQREQWIDFMVDLARFEYQVFSLFDAPGHEGKPFAAHNTADEILQLQPCFALGDYRFPVAWYYHQVRQENQPKIPAMQRSLIALLRKDFLTHTFQVSFTEYQFLSLLSQGSSVESALQRVAEQTELPVEQLRDSWSSREGARARWIDAGFFIAGS